MSSVKFSIEKTYWVLSHFLADPKRYLFEFSESYYNFENWSSGSKVMGNIN